MSKVSTLCIISLLLSLTLSHAVARPLVRFNDVTPAETQQDQHLKAEKEAAVERSCEGQEEDECMMRKTLEAHIDYIYTQKAKP